MKTLKSAAGNSSKEHQGRSSAQEGSAKKGVVGFPSHTPPPISPNQPAQFKSVKVGKGKNETKVEWVEGNLAGSGDTVGLDMTAENLHIANVDEPGLYGTPPKTSAQKDLMGKLPTQPSLKATDKYIKGHLLNHNIGGPGEDFNLFPLTGSANKAHSQFVEETVKKWVRGGKHVDYRVKASSDDYNLKAGPKKGYVNGMFECYAKNLATDEKISTNIISEYKAKAEVEDDDKDDIMWDEDKNPFEKNSWLGEAYEAIKKQPDQAKVDGVVDLLSSITLKGMDEEFKKKKDGTVGQMIKEMIKETFDTKAVHFTDKQKLKIEYTVKKICYAYLVNQDETEQKEYEDNYPTLIKVLTMKKS